MGGDHLAEVHLALLPQYRFTKKEHIPQHQLIDIGLMHLVDIASISSTELLQIIHGFH